MERTDLRSGAGYRDHFPERLLRAKPVSAVRMLGVGSLNQREPRQMELHYQKWNLKRLGDLGPQGIVKRSLPEARVQVQSQADLVLVFPASKQGTHQDRIGSRPRRALRMLGGTQGVNM